ncbi:hypothetical protein PPUJ13061_57280 [Pseudomonas putida]|uniref:hypothetical protein n=1 Tax=Pseudomonas TaxID=286 RepID=UPI000E0CE716|nr:MULTISPECIES: hypothetical protein [Pseudomonas]MBC3422214.1 hypothetical protein [Pseudomonas sp. RW3S2]WQE55669.1 hypothetical protein U0028_08360 [Pseudomonas putida]GLO05824.1 hypothetical protein PPUJ13061_57280 [Pseudomonas putida]HDS1004847.1 hypothetical protein [Pseudomonas putida]
MSNELNEEDMRRALFGVSTPAQIDSRSSDGPLKKSVAARLGSLIRVTLHVTNEYEGDYKVVTYDGSNLSRLVVELEAQKKYKKKFRYVTVVSVDRV